MNEKKYTQLSRYRWDFIGIWAVILTTCLSILTLITLLVVAICSSS